MIGSGYCWVNFLILLRTPSWPLGHKYAGFTSHCLRSGCSMLDWSSSQTTQSPWFLVILHLLLRICQKTFGARLLPQGLIIEEWYIPNRRGRDRLDFLYLRASQTCQRANQ